MISLRLFCRDISATVSYHSGRLCRPYSSSQWLIARSSFTSFSICSNASSLKTICLTRFPIANMGPQFSSYRAISWECGTAEASSECRNIGRADPGAWLPALVGPNRLRRYHLFRHTMDSVCGPRSSYSVLCWGDRREEGLLTQKRNPSRRNRDTPWLFYFCPSCPSWGSAARSQMNVNTEPRQTVPEREGCSEFVTK